MNTSSNFSNPLSIALDLVPMLIFLLYFLSYKLFTIIVKISVKKNITVSFINRSAHTGWCTNLGGVIIYFGLVFSTSCYGSYFLLEFDPSFIRPLTAAVTVLFFVGLKDDLISISNRNKILGQLIAFTIMIFVSQLRLDSLGGILGLHQLPIVVSYLITYFAFFFILNAYNLSDGIDGLAGSIALLANLFFAMYFYVHHELCQSVIAFTLIGILLAFLKFNFADRYKIIMGDSGSMVLGFVLCCQFLYFQSFNSALPYVSAIDNSFLYLFVLFSYPIVDTTRIFFIRIKQGRSPFSADKNHLHHTLLAKGLSHGQATACIVVVTVVLLALAYAVRGLSINLGLPILIVMAYVFYTRVSLYKFPAIFFLKHTSDL